MAACVIAKRRSALGVPVADAVDVARRARAVRRSAGRSASRAGAAGRPPPSRRAGRPSCDADGGSCACQAAGSPSAPSSTARTSTRTTSFGVPPSTRVALKDTEKSHQRISNDALPESRSGRGPSSSPATETLKRLWLPRLSWTLARKLGQEVERQELDQHVEADVAVDAEAERRGVQRAVGSELHGVRGDREVGLADQLGVVAVGQRELQPRDAREARRRGELRVQAADGQREARPSRATPSASPSHR